MIPFGGPVAAVLATPWVRKIGKWLAVAGVVLLVLLRVRNAGRQAERIESLEKTVTNAARRKEVDREVHRLPGGTAADELHDKWSRD